MAGYETILLDIADDIAIITLNRPERLNAAPIEMADEIVTALDEALDAGARAVLMTGAGRAFCSGADLAGGRDRTSGVGGGGDRAKASLENHYNPMMKKLAELPVPLVTAVNGPAAGIGCSMALAGDFVLVGESGYFLQAFVNIGLVPDGGASWTLPRLIGKARAFEMMMLGEKIPAAKAADWGMVYKVVEDGALMDEARALAAKLAKGPTLALGLMRRTAAENLDRDFGAALDAEANAQREAGNSQDAVIGAVAFLKKEKAVFTGK
ncbi:enoyl-CoA hydratase-related protein [Parasphingopyxis marina]|uniref:Enoyl-CoA hydratase/isomerase family protein n=1 Tax=Parasphingopyxis marina TaxID=2761622 RepID=A0A842I0V6_9SPHN|nr:enoyl-CoA hydratase-related protein [Parasphingopyxis marina]MBC2777394.1 enoyl-CoA hydratase/isomerase family protein [Parasphingopyxis marina]